ncbi:MAG: porin family protein [Bacteroidota bacterium]
MKTKFLILISFFIVGTAIAQRNSKVENLPKYDRKPYHFGFSLGINKYDFSIKNVDNFNQLDSVHILESTPQNGFNICMVSSLKLTEHLDLRFLPGLSFGGRSLDYTLQVAGNKIIKESKMIESVNIEFPLTLKYKSARYNNGRAYLLGGFKYTLDKASQAGKKDNVEEKLIKLKKNDYCYEIGFGVDIYFEYFKFSPEIKFSMGLKDLLVRDGQEYTKSIDRLNSKVLLISFLFE